MPESKGTNFFSHPRWKHPVTLLLLSSALAALGWLGNYIFRLSSDARIQIEDARQISTLPDHISNAVEPAAPASSEKAETPDAPGPVKSSAPLAGRYEVTARLQNPRQDIDQTSKPAYLPDGSRIFCDTMMATLVVSHNHEDTAPVVINRISFHAEPMPNLGSHFCKIDPLSSLPQGIAIKNSFLFALSDEKMEGRFIGSGSEGKSFPVPFRNILENPAGSEIISLSQNEIPVVWDIYIFSNSPRVMKVWFSISYDAKGAKERRTPPVYIAGSTG